MTGPTFLATAAAVVQGHSLIEAAASALAGRVTVTGIKLRTAGTSYTATDGGSADQIAAVGRTVQV